MVCILIEYLLELLVIVYLIVALLSLLCLSVCRWVPVALFVDRFCAVFVCWCGFFLCGFVYLLFCLDWCVCFLVLVISVVSFICGFLPFTYTLLVLTLLGFCLPNSVGFCYFTLRFELVLVFWLLLLFGCCLLVLFVLLVFIVG